MDGFGCRKAPHLKIKFGFSASRQAQGSQRDSGCPERELEASTSSSSSAATLRPDYKPRGRL